jgi:hypothetical protein
MTTSYHSTCEKFQRKREKTGAAGFLSNHSRSECTRVSQEGEVHLLPDSRAWFDWLATISPFRFVGPIGRGTRASYGSGF